MSARIILIALLMLAGWVNSGICAEAQNASRTKDRLIQGLRARGDDTVDIAWAGGELTKATIRAGDRSAGEVRVVYKNKSKALSIEAGKTASITPKDF